MRTTPHSTAELLFNQGSLVRLGAKVIFRFIPRLRSFQLRNGTVLARFRLGSGDGKIITPEAIVVGRGTVMRVRHNSASQTTLVGALTNNPPSRGSVTEGVMKGKITRSSTEFSFRVRTSPSLTLT